jgi:hypothetical protein
VTRRNTALALTFLWLAWGGASPARGQEAIGAGIAENIAAGRAATDFNTRVRVRTGYWNTAKDTKIVPTRISGTWAPHPSLAFRLQLPLFYTNPTGASSQFGTSDLSARVLWRAWEHPRAAAFVGLEMFFPTASDPMLGTEKYSISPIALAFLPITKRLFFIPVYQQLISYAGDNDRADLNILRFRPILVAQWPRRWFTLLDPGFLWDLEDDLETKDTMTLGLEVGKQVTDHIVMSGKPSIQVYGTEDFAWAFELSFTYRFD